MLLLRQLVVLATTAGEVASTPSRILIIDLDAVGMVNGFPVTARTRQLTIGSTHERILSREKQENSGSDGSPTHNRILR